MSMHQVIELRFDSETEKLLDNARTQLSQQGFATIEPEGVPHLSLASFAAGNSAIWKKALEEVAVLDPIKLDFSYIGIFPGETSVLYLGVTPNSILRAAHEHVYEHATYLAKDLNQLYLPGSCVFHVTLANGIEKKMISNAVDFTLGLEMPKKGIGNRIALVEYSPAEVFFEKELGGK